MLFVVLWGKSSLWALQHFLITSTLRTWKCKNAQAWGESELRRTCMGGVDAGVWFEAGTQLYVENDSHSLNVSSSSGSSKKTAPSVLSKSKVMR